MALLTRPLASAAAVALLALALLALLPECAYACSCGGVFPFREVAKGAHSSAVFSGEVVDIEKGLQVSSVTFRVSEVWKGKQRETRTVGTPRYGMSCGYPFKEGQEYLIGGRRVHLLGPPLRPIPAPRPSRSLRRMRTSGCLGRGRVQETTRSLCPTAREG